MGRDKAHLAIDGVPMAVRVAGALRAAGADDVVCAGGAVADLGVATIDDEEPGAGPLSGLVAALRWANGAPVLAAPCDLLTPDSASFAAIVGALRGATGALLALPIVGDAWQPLNAAFAPGALDPLAAAFAAGERSVKRAIAPLPRVEVRDLDPRVLADADTPEELPPVG